MIVNLATLVVLPLQKLVQIARVGQNVVEDHVDEQDVVVLSEGEDSVRDERGDFPPRHDGLGRRIVAHWPLYAAQGGKSGIYNTTLVI